MSILCGKVVGERALEVLPGESPRKGDVSGGLQGGTVVCRVWGRRVRLGGRGWEKDSPLAAWLGQVAETFPRSYFPFAEEKPVGAGSTPSGRQ